MNVIGLDLSLTGTGVATPTGTYLVPSTGHKGATLTDRRERLHRILTGICQHGCPAPQDLVVVEAPSLGQARQGGTHDRAGLWWIVVSHLLDRACHVIEVPPATLKKYVTGKGNAKKPDMRMAIYKRYGVDITDDNEADAFALRALGLDLLGQPLAAMPAVNRTALDKLTVPERPPTNHDRLAAAGYVTPGDAS